MKLNGAVITKPIKAIQNTAAYDKVKQLLRELSDDEYEDEDIPALSLMHSDPQRPWLQEFHGYLNSKDQLALGMLIVWWWGLNAARYLVWSSLACDYLSIMATSVSSERAFSSSAIMISKRCSCLTGDVVEALQCLKCFIQRDLLFRELQDPSVMSEYGNEEDLLSSREDKDLEKPDDIDDSDIVTSMLRFE